MAVKFVQTFLDHSREVSSTQFWIQEAAGDDFTTAITTAGIVAAALDAVSLCNPLTRTLSQQVADVVAVLPTDPFAQRESAMKVYYQDVVTGSKHTLTVPGINLTLVAQANTDEIDVVSNVAAAALKTALDLSLASPEGNAIVVTRMRYIGRRS